MRPTKEKLVATIRKGKIKLFNRYSRLCQKKNIIIDFSYADMSNANMSYANMSYANMSYANGVDYIYYFSRIGSRNDDFWYDAKNDIVTCGCFSGTLKQFIKKVKATHGNNQHGLDYLAAIAYIKKRIKNTGGEQSDNTKRKRAL